MKIAPNSESLVDRLLPVIDRHLHLMQWELSDACDQVPDSSCYRCGQAGHLARNCFRMYPLKKVGAQ